MAEKLRRDWNRGMLEEVKFHLKCKNEMEVAKRRACHFLFLTICFSKVAQYEFRYESNIFRGKKAW